MVSQEQAITEQQISQENILGYSDDDQSRASQVHSTTTSTKETVKSSEETLTEPTNPRLAAIAAKTAKLQNQLAELQSQRSELVAEAKMPSGLDMPAEWSDEQRTQQALTSANAVINDHIKNLHRYNEIKDIGQGLMGLVADKKGVRVAEVMADYDMNEKD